MIGVLGKKTAGGSERSMSAVEGKGTAFSYLLGYICKGKQEEHSFWIWISNKQLWSLRIISHTSLLFAGEKRNTTKYRPLMLPNQLKEWNQSSRRRQPSSANWILSFWKKSSQRLAFSLFNISKSSDCSRKLFPPATDLPWHGWNYSEKPQYLCLLERKIFHEVQSRLYVMGVLFWQKRKGTTVKPYGEFD